MKSIQVFFYRNGFSSTTRCWWLSINVIPEIWKNLRQRKTTKAAKKEFTLSHVGLCVSIKLYFLMIRVFFCAKYFLIKKVYCAFVTKEFHFKDFISYFLSHKFFLVPSHIKHFIDFFCCLMWSEKKIPSDGTRTKIIHNFFAATKQNCSYVSSFTVR